MDALDAAVTRPVATLLGEEVLLGRAEDGSFIMDLLAHPIAIAAIGAIFTSAANYVAHKAKMSELRKTLGAFGIQSNIDQRDEVMLEALVNKESAEIVSLHGKKLRATPAEAATIAKIAVRQAGELLEAGVRVELLPEGEKEPPRVIMIETGSKDLM